MAEYVKIIIDGQDCDLPSELISLKLTYALRDRKGIAINTGSRSEYSFELPATKQNDTIFQTFWEVARINPDAQVFRPAYVEVDGLPYFNGQAQLTSVTTQNDTFSWQGLKYKVAFYGSNIDWVSQIRDKKLYEYAFSTHTFNDGTILAGWSNEYPANDYGYTLIKWKDWNYPNKVQYQESTPFLFIAAIVDAIFDDLGYTVNSNFFGLDFFRRLIMPIPLPEKFDGGFSDDYLTIAADETGRLLSSFPLAATLVYTNQTVAPAIGGNPYNVGTGQYTAPYDGFYLFEYRAEVSSVTGTSIGLTMQVYQNGTPVANSQVGTNGITGNQTIKGEWVVEAAASDLITIVMVRNTTAGDCNVDFYLDVKGEIPVKSGTPIDFKYLINKEWKALDFLKGLAHAFNLVFQTDALAQTVTIEPSDQYLNQRQGVASTLEDGFYTNDFIDITSKVDLDKSGNLKSSTDEGEYLGLSWKYEGQTEEAINENEDIKFFEGRYIFPANRFNREGKVLENPFFAATLQMADNTIKDSNSTATPLIPLIWNDNYFENPTSSEANYNVLPRILFKDAQTLESYDAQIRVDNGAGGFTTVTCPLAYMVNYLNPNNNYMPLSFGNINANGVELKGLLDRFYLSEMKRKEVGKELELYAYWKLLDIMNLDFQNKRTINSDAYILQEINSFDVLNDASTKTYLLYDAQVETTDSDKVVSSEVDNKVVE